MTFHSITCLPVCPGSACACWCHDCGVPQPNTGVSAGQNGCAGGKLAPAMTNGPGLQPETVLSHPIDRTEGMT